MRSERGGTEPTETSHVELKRVHLRCNSTQNRRKARNRRVRAERKETKTAQTEVFYLPPRTAAGVAMPAPPAAGTGLQRVYDLAKSVFANAVKSTPSRDKVAVLRTAMERVSNEELGLFDPLREDGRGFRPYTGVVGGTRQFLSAPSFAPPITYLHICENNSFSIGIFCLPTNACIPLHNHPGMTVVSRLMYGSMYVKSYDWCSEDDPEATTEFARPAKLVQESVISGPAGTLVLYPKEGNIHSFTALTPCAVLDVLGPPYAPSKGRDCTYYKEQPCSMEEDNDKGFTVGLQEFEPPDDFVVERGVYRGYRIKE